MRRWKKVLAWAGGLLGALGLAIAIAAAALHEPRPEGAPGPEAEAYAGRMERAVDLEAWARTGAVRWRFPGGHEHLWDRARRVARVGWGDAEALLREGPSGRAYRGGREVHGEDARELLETAYAHWINDSFWLNPIAKMRDEGVTRAIVRLEDGSEGLLVSYASGGLTPGDAYLWIAGEDGLPREWRLWVSVIPIGGVSTTWERWVTLETGARIATRHVGPLGLAVELEDVEGAATLEALVGGPDPFAPLFEEGGG